jgi:Na+-transporting NADH:ubiquinone oxidoreductase subunit NqrF
MSARDQAQSLTSLEDRRGTKKAGPPKIFNFWGEEEVRQAKLACEFLLASHFRRGPPMMSKTVLDLLHSLGVEDDMIMFDNFGG